MSKRVLRPRTTIVLVSTGMAVAVGAGTPAARAADSGWDDLHPNLIRADAFTVVPAGAGTEQDVTTRPGGEYRLTFDYAEHPLGEPGAAAFDITFGTTTLTVPVPIGPVTHRHVATLVAPALGTVTRLTVTAVDPSPGPGGFPGRITVRSLR